MAEFNTFHVSSIGASHLKSGKVCQDYALSSHGDKYALAVVCDGHGGDKYFRSDRGSRLAAKICTEAVKLLFNRKDNQNTKGVLGSNPEATLQQLISYVIFNWREAVGKDYSSQLFTEQELSQLSDKDKASASSQDGWVSAYGTTLIVAVRTSDFWFGFQIGDGKCVVVMDVDVDEYLQPIPWDDKCFLNATTSLCDEKAMERFRMFFSTENLPKAIFIATDGVDDTFGTDEALQGFYKTLIQLFNEKGLEKGKEELQAYLPGLSAKGSQDDISIAGILMKNQLKNKK